MSPVMRPGDAPAPIDVDLNRIFLGAVGIATASSAMTKAVDRLRIQSSARRYSCVGIT